MREAFVYEAVRTPRGRVRKDGGTLAGVPAYELLAGLLTELTARGVPADAVQDVIAGVSTAHGEQAAEVTRMAVMAAGWPDTVPGGMVSRMCTSGLDALATGAAQVRSGMADLVVAGGAESMSRVPMCSDRPAFALDEPLGELTGFVTIGVSADLTAARHGFTRQDLDGWAVRSHQRAAAASCSPMLLSCSASAPAGTRCSSSRRHHPDGGHLHPRRLLTSLRLPNVGNGDVPQQIDTSKPHPARVYDYFLGGKDNFAADREVARQALQVAPSMRTAVRENRAFLGRAVRYLVEEAGITQFLDLGSGLPAVGNVHEVAQSVQPSARVVYVDNDPIVLAHARALLASTPQGKCAYLQADIRDPQYILGHQLTRDTLDFGQPVALILNAVLHFFADENEPGKIAATVLDALPSGSYVAASHGTAEYSPARRVADGVSAYQQGGMPVYMRDGSEFAALAFKGLTLVPPGVMVVSEWRREPGSFPPPADEVGINGAVARKP